MSLAGQGVSDPTSLLDTFPVCTDLSDRDTSEMHGCFQLPDGEGSQLELGTRPATVSSSALLSSGQPLHREAAQLV